MQEYEIVGTVTDYATPAMEEVIDGLKRLGEVIMKQEEVNARSDAETANKLKQLVHAAGSLLQKLTKHGPETTKLQTLLDEAQTAADDVAASAQIVVNRF